MLHKSQQDFAAACRNLKNEKGLLDENKQLILDFAKARLANGSSRLRVVKCMYCLRYLAKWLNKPFGQATKQDLTALVGDLENQDYAEYTKYDFKIVLKMFFKWFKGNGEEFPEEIKWLKPKLRHNAHKLPEELLTEEEVMKIAETATSPRDKAIVMVLYETGCRIGELLSLKMKNVSFDQYGAVLRITGKTGDRRVRIISSTSLLTNWISHYENASEPEAPLWPPRSTNYWAKSDAAEYASILKLIKTLAQRAGIKKKVYPHLFRHSRATFLASKLTEAQMKEYFGWTQGSEMAATYVHLSGRDVDNALLRLFHITDENGNKVVEKEPEIKIKTCQRCREHNSPISKYCHKCGNPLDVVMLVEAVETPV